MQKDVRLKVLKINRKWIKVELEDYNSEVDLELNDASKHVEVNSYYTFRCEVDKKYSKFGTKTKLYPICEIVNNVEPDEESSYSDYMENVIEDIEKQLVQYRPEMQNTLIEQINTLPKNSNEYKIYKDRYLYVVDKFNIDFLVDVKKNNYIRMVQYTGLGRCLIKYFKNYVTLNISYMNKINEYESNLKIGITNVTTLILEKLLITDLYDKLTLSEKTYYMKELKGILDYFDIYEKYRDIYADDMNMAFEKIYIKEDDILLISQIDEEVLTSENAIKYDDLVGVSGIEDKITNIFEMHFSCNSFTCNNDDDSNSSGCISKDGSAFYQKCKMKQFNQFVVNDVLYKLNYILDESQEEQLRTNGIIKVFTEKCTKKQFYLTKYPGIVFRYLVESGVVSYDNGSVASELIEDRECIVKYAKIDMPFKYKKEKIHGNMFYVIEKNNYIDSQNLYRVYYLMSVDELNMNNVGVWRLPYKDISYNSLDIKSFIDDLFLINDGYSQIKGSLIYKKVGLASKSRQQFVKERSYVQYIYDDLIITKKLLSETTQIVIDEKVDNVFKSEGSKFIEIDNYELRKNNMYISGNGFEFESGFICDEAIIRDEHGDILFKSEGLCAVLNGPIPDEVMYAVEKIKYNIYVIKKIDEVVCNTKQTISKEVIEINKLKYQFENKLNVIEDYLDSYRIKGCFLEPPEGDEAILYGEFSVTDKDGFISAYGEEGVVFTLKTINF